MTVQELIALLTMMPADAEVFVALDLADAPADSVELVDGAVVIS